MKLSLDKLLNRLQKCENVDVLQCEEENSPKSSPSQVKVEEDKVSDV